MSEYGQLRPDAERCAVRFERLYDFTPDELWSALTGAERLRGWLGAASRWTLVPGEEYELDVGGATRGQIRAVEPGRVLELTWAWGDEPESLVRFEIVPRERGTLLVLDHSRLPREQAAAYGAGWHAHLDLLEAFLARRSESWDDRYRGLRREYDERAAALGAGWAGPGGNALLDAVAAGDVGRASELAREAPELREQRDGEGLLPATRALYVDGSELARALLPDESLLNVYELAAFGRLERLAEVLDARAERVHERSPDGFTPLHGACFSGGVQATRLLIERGADVEAISRHPQVQVRPLGTAAFSGDRQSALALLKAGADPNGEGVGGFVPLHTAAQNGDRELVRLLLEHGADPERRTPDGRSPAVLARAAGHDECARLLESHG